MSPSTADDTLRVVVAPDSFKGSASADEVAAAFARGWSSARPRDRVDRLPMADGGEGTLDTIEAAVTGAERVPVTVTGPDGRPVSASWLRLPDGTAVVELASTSGIMLIGRLDPLRAHTLGLGQAVAAALAAGVERVIVALGSSCSSDGGAGALTALGARLVDGRGEIVALGAAGLLNLAVVDLTDVAQRPPGGVVLLTDVDAPLLGPLGAARVFGPQKGAGDADVGVIESALERWAEVLGGRADATAAGAGAAGGTAFGLSAWGAGIDPGGDVVAELVGLDRAVARADVVVTGEGRFDAQTAGGKLPNRVLASARRSSVPCMLVAGSVTATPFGYADVVELASLAGSAAASIADPVRWLERAGFALATRV